MSGAGQKQTKNYVRCHGSFRRKQPWRPHSQRSRRTLREQGEAGRPAPRWRPVCQHAFSLSAHQWGRQGHGAGAQCACAALASRSDSPHRSPAAFRPGRRRILTGMGTRPRSRCPRQHARQRRAVVRHVLAVTDVWGLAWCANDLKMPTVIGGMIGDGVVFFAPGRATLPSFHSEVCNFEQTLWVAPQRMPTRRRNLS
jgi:hypothetical protein